MNILKNFLMAVVFFYAVYAIYREGISTAAVLLLILVFLSVGMEIWMKSDLRKKLRNKQ